MSPNKSLHPTHPVHFGLLFVCLLLSGCQSSDQKSTRASPYAIPLANNRKHNHPQQQHPSVQTRQTLEMQTSAIHDHADVLCSTTPPKYQSLHPEAISISDDLTQPILIKKVDANLDRLKGIRMKFGVTILMAVITEDGTVKDPCLIRSYNPEFDRALVEAVQQWKYKPARKHGKAVAVLFTVTSHPEF
jgi:TonB family protein